MARLKKWIGIYGGTFDPPHNGHLALARAAIDQLALQQVLWVLTRRSPHKTSDFISPVEIRIQLLQAALEGLPEFQISRVEIDREPPYYAADTLRLLKAAYPRVGLVYLMGGDSLFDLPTWHEPVEFTRLCRAIGVLVRPGYEIDLDRLEGQIPGLKAKLRWIEIPMMDISASMIRKLVLNGLPYETWVPPKVASLIEKLKLYRNEEK